MQHVIFSDVPPSHNQLDIRLCVSTIIREYDNKSDRILFSFSFQYTVRKNILYTK